MKLNSCLLTLIQADSSESSEKEESASEEIQGNQDNHEHAETDVPCIAEAIKAALAVFSYKECGKNPCGCDEAEASPAETQQPLTAAPVEALVDEEGEVPVVPQEEMPVDEPSDESEESESSDSGSDDSEGSESDSDGSQDRNAAEDKDPVTEDQSAPVTNAEQAATGNDSGEQGADEDEAEGVEMGTEAEGEADRVGHNGILSQAQDLIATGIYGLHLGDGSLGQEEILSDLQEITAAMQPPSPQAPAEDVQQDDLPAEQPPPSSDNAAIASPVLSDAEHAAEEAAKLVDGAIDSLLDGDPFEMVDAPAASSYDLSAAQPLTAASVGAGGQMDADSGGQSQVRRSPKRPAAEEPLEDDWLPRRRRKRTRTLCRRLLSILPRPLRRLTRFGGRAYWRGVRRPTSSTSGSSQESTEPEVVQEALVDLTEAEGEASGGQADGGLLFQGSMPAAQDAIGEESHGDEDASDHDGAQDESHAQAASDSEAGRVRIEASGIFLTGDIAAEEELNEEELALLAVADAEARARQADGVITQVT